MVFHRHHHGPLHAVRNVGWSGDEQKISTWHAGSHHALLCGYQTALVSRAGLPPERARARCDPYYLSGAGGTKRLSGWTEPSPRRMAVSQRFALMFILSQCLRARAKYACGASRKTTRDVAVEKQ